MIDWQPWLPNAEGLYHAGVEELPPENTLLLVTLDHLEGGQQVVVLTYRSVRGWTTQSEKTRYKHTEILAWAPMPKPWEPKEDT